MDYFLHLPPAMSSSSLSLTALNRVGGFDDDSPSLVSSFSLTFSSLFLNFDSNSNVCFSLDLQKKTKFLLIGNRKKKYMKQEQMLVLTRKKNFLLH